MTQARRTDRDTIKLLAALSMLPNHIAEMFLPEDTLLRALLIGIGYMAAITMCFFLTEGFRFTSSRRRYGTRLLVFALLSELPYLAAFSGPGTGAQNELLTHAPLNMIFTLFLCFLILFVREMPLLGRTERALSVGALLLLSSLSDWGILAPLFVLFFASSKPSESGRRKAFAACLLLLSADHLLEVLFLGYPPEEGLLRVLLSLTGPLLAAFLILFCYDGRAHRSGKHRKAVQYFFYLFYPAHLAILCLVRFLFFS